MKKALQLSQIVLSLWVIYIFLWSLPYKFTWHPHTQNIFGTIGTWISDTISWPVWAWFSSYAAYVIWSLELLVSLILIWALYFTAKKNYERAWLLFWIWWLGAMCLMVWAVFFHLVTPLWIEVNGDGWSLFRAAVSIVFIGLFMLVNNCKHVMKLIKK